MIILTTKKANLKPLDTVLSVGWCLGVDLGLGVIFKTHRCSSIRPRWA